MSLANFAFFQSSPWVSFHFFFFSLIIFLTIFPLASIASFVGNQPSEPVTVTNDPNELDPSPVRNQKVVFMNLFLICDNG